MPHYIKTGYWALEKNGYKGWLKLEDIISGGGGVIEVDYTTLQSLISSNQLSPGAIYKITGFNKNMPDGGPENPNGYLPEVLYDDGTNSGITIYLQAITTNTLSESGHGEFYNPIYGDQTTYNNTDGTGLYGIWDGDNPDPLQVPAYQVDQVVFWGGYAWKNLTGNVGVADDTLNLDPTDWEKLPYSNTTYYEKVIDEIKVDLNNGILIGRTNVENQITVEFNADQYSWWMGFDYNPVSVMGWGLYSKVTPEGLDNEFYGISNVSVINSVCETVNFKGGGFLNVKMNDSYLFENYFGIKCYLTDISMSIYSSMENNTVTGITFGYSTIESNILINSRIDNNILIYSSINSNTLTSSNINGNLMQSSNTLPRFTINNNTLTDSSIQNNTLSGNNFTVIQYNTLTDGNIQSNTLTNGSSIQTNTLTNSSIQSNTLSNSVIYNNISTINSSIESNILTDSYITYNTLVNSSFDFSTSGTLTSKTISNIEANYAVAIFNISAATIIYGNYTKQIFTRQDGTVKLSYYDNTDVLQVVAVNA